MMEVVYFSKILVPAQQSSMIYVPRRSIENTQKGWMTFGIGYLVKVVGIIS
jgi:hypothetical protein